MNYSSLPSLDPSLFRPENEIFYSTASDYEFGPYKSMLSIKYCIQGKEYYQVNDQKITLNQGEYLIINPGDEVNYKSSQSHKGVSIFLDKEVHANMITNISIPDVDSFGIWLRAKINLDSQTRDHFFVDCKSALGCGHSRLIESLEGIDRIKKNTKLETMRRLMKAIQYMNNHLNKPFFLDEVADEAFMSKHHFLRSFRSFYKITPWQYFHNQQMELAYRELISTTASVEEISANLGFSRLSVFSRSIKEYFGLSPMKLRSEFDANRRLS